MPTRSKITTKISKLMSTTRIRVFFYVDSTSVIYEFLILKNKYNLDKNMSENAINKFCSLNVKIYVTRESYFLINLFSSIYSLFSNILSYLIKAFKRENRFQIVKLLNH